MSATKRFATPASKIPIAGGRVATGGFSPTVRAIAIKRAYAGRQTAAEPTFKPGDKVSTVFQGARVIGTVGTEATPFGWTKGVPFEGKPVVHWANLELPITADTRIATEDDLRAWEELGKKAHEEAERRLKEARDRQQSKDAETPSKKTGATRKSRAAAGAPSAKQVQRPSAAQAAGSAVKETGKGPADVLQSDGEAKYSRFRTEQRSPDDFVPAPDGSPDFGQIDNEVATAVGGEAAPIRLQQGKHNSRTGDGFGLMHVEGQRGAAIRKAGYTDATALIADVAGGYRRRVYGGHSGRFIIVKPNGKAKLAVIELDRSGGYWTVVSAGVYRPSYLRHKKLLWEGERRSPIAAGQADNPLQRGGQSEDNVTPDEDERHSLSGARLKLSAADKAKVKDSLEAQLKRLAPNANLAFVDDLVDGVGTGKYLQGLVTVSLGYGDPEVTLRHEAIHALKEMGLFTREEWAVLEQAARRDWAKKHDVAGKYPDLSKAAQLEEAIAQAFAEFQQGKPMLPKYRRIFAKVRDLLTRFANALRGLGFNSAESIFERVESGEVGRRPEGFSEMTGEARYAAADPMDKRVPIIEVTRRFSQLPFADARKQARRWAKDHIRGSYINADQGWSIEVDGGGIGEATSGTHDPVDLDILSCATVARNGRALRQRTASHRRPKPACLPLFRQCRPRRRSDLFCSHYGSRTDQRHAVLRSSQFREDEPPRRRSRGQRTRRRADPWFIGATHY